MEVSSPSMVDNVKVCCRFRPLNSNERAENVGECAKFHANDTVDCLVSEESVTHSFTFTRVFKPDSTQKGVYDEVGAPIVEQILQGYNGTIFVYGQTGSGKTHTMMGAQAAPVTAPTSTPGQHRDPNAAVHTVHPGFQFGTSEEGVVPRAIKDLFRRMESASSTMEFELRMHFVEIYMEHVKDLLDPTKTNLNVREDPTTQSFYVDGCANPYVSSYEEVMNLIGKGLENRTTASTKMNEVSSRSHCLLGLYVKSHDTAKGEQKIGKLFMVDLAGSEKVFKTGAVGQQLEEAKLINKSLTTLGLVINNLTDKASKHIPYRDSKLTKILADSLGGNSKTALVICCSPSSFNDQETLSTLRFGQRAKNIKNRAVINKEYTLEELKALLEAAESEISRLRAGGAVAPDMDVLKVTAKLEERERYFNARLHEEEDKNAELQSELSAAQAAVSDLQAQNALLEEEVDAWQQEYSMLHAEMLAVDRSFAMEKKQKQSVADCFENYVKTVTNDTKRDIEAIRLSCAQAMEETNELISISSNQKEVAVAQGEERVSALQQQLAFAKHEMIKLEENWNVAMDDLGGQQLELEMLQKQLHVRNQRVDNLKKGLRQEKVHREDLERQCARDHDTLMSQILELRSDAELWRNRFESLSQTQDARKVSSRIVKHVRGGSSGNFASGQFA